MAETLKLAALDAEDLAVISVHLQDAVLRVGDIKYLKGSGKLALFANRFVWDGAPGSRAHERRRSCLDFAQVKAVKAQRILMGDPEAVLSLLAVTFAGSEAPSGTVTLAFSGGGALQVEVDCIEARLEDLGPAWETPHRPSHEL